MKLRTGRPSHATVIAYVALFVALSGTALAASGKIGPGKIKKGAVTEKKIHKKAVTESRIDDGAVTTPKIADLAVTQGKLGDASVSNGKLQGDSVSQGKLQGDSVSQGKIQANAISSGKIAANAVTGTKVLDGSLGLAKVAQLVVNDSDDIGSVAALTCEITNPITVSGLQNVSSLLVIPRISGWSSSFSLAGYWPESSTTVRMRVCNESLAPVDPGPLPVRILGFS